MIKHKHENYLVTRNIDNDFLKLDGLYVNDLTRYLNSHRYILPKTLSTYMMEFKKEQDTVIYAIRGCGRTSGNVITDKDGYIKSIILDEDIYTKEAFEKVKKYIGKRIIFVE